MPKKRKCRFTTEELEVHDLAVKLRKMTDQQLVEAFREASQDASQTSQNAPQSAGYVHTANDVGDVERLLNALSDGKCKGIGNGTVYKIAEFAKEMGLV